jgi:hypothetical protein
MNENDQNTNYWMVFSKLSSASIIFQPSIFVPILNHIQQIVKRLQKVVPQVTLTLKCANFATFGPLPYICSFLWDMY